jgi:hypothetical protein
MVVVPGIEEASFMEKVAFAFDVDAVTVGTLVSPIGKLYVYDVVCIENPERGVLFTEIEDRVASSVASELAHSPTIKLYGLFELFRSPPLYEYVK